jgi:hypothetical protein
VPETASELLEEDPSSAAGDGSRADYGPLEARRLQGVVLAQRWDISGLTEQRDRARAEVEQLKQQLTDEAARLAVATGEAETARRQYDELRQLAHLSGSAIDGLLREPLSPSGRMAVERALIQACGLFDEDYYRRANPVPAKMPDALLHYLQEGDRRGFDPHPLFSPSHYVDQLGDTAALPGSSLAHYLLRGWRAGLAPHPLFDPGFYAERELPPPDVPPLLHFVHFGAARSAAPHPIFLPEFYRRRRGLQTGNSLALIRDFLLLGWRNALDPHPLFDAHFYLTVNQDVRDIGANPIIHYILHGAREGRRPHPLFDPAFYERQIEASSVTGAATLTHYLTVGSRRGLRPHPLFDDGYYRVRYPDVEREGVAGLAHFIEFGAGEDRNPHPAFDIGYLRRSRPDLFAHEPNPVIRFLTDPRCRNVSPTIVFDPDYYLRRYPEVRSSEVGPFLHFLLWGAAEGRDPHPVFDTEFYDRQAGGWRRRSTDPISDFIRFGSAEGHRPHPLFDPVYYLEKYHDVRDAGVNPLVHYLEFGGRDDERRWPHPLFNADHYYRSGASGQSNGRTLLEDFLIASVDSLVDPSPVFSSAYYLSQSAASDRSVENPLVHYARRGAESGADPHPLFSHAHYRKQSPQLPNPVVSLLEHYCTVGFKEGLSPHPMFDNDFVHEQSPEFFYAGKDPLQHYIEQPLNAGYEPNRWLDSTSYNIIEQQADPDAINPLTHYVLHGGRNPKLPSGPKSEPSGRLQVDPVASNYDGLREELRREAKSGGRSRPLVRSVVENAIARRFLDDHALHVFGSLPASPKAPGGIALYAIYNDSGRLTSSQRATLAALRSAGHATVVINSTLVGGRSLAAQAATVADVVVLRESGGRDFASWFAVLLRLFGEVCAYDHCLLINDSLIGPVSSLDPVWSAFAASPAEVWGLTDSTEARQHLQSSFLIIRRQALTSAAMVYFLTHYEFPDERFKVVRQGEIGLASALDLGGIKVGVMAPYQKVASAWLRSQVERERWCDEIELGNAAPSVSAVLPSGLEVAFASYARRWSRNLAKSLRRGDTVNPQHVFYDTLYQRFQYPFLKKDLLTFNPCRVPSVIALPELLESEGRQVALDSLKDVATSRVGLPTSVLRVSQEVLRSWQPSGGEK